MKKIVIIMGSFVLLLMGCQNNANETNGKSDVTPKETYTTTLKNRKTGDTFIMKSEDVDELVRLTELCAYDGDQKSPENPSGYQATAAASDYLIEIKNGDKVLKVIRIWNREFDKLMVDEWWYYMDDQQSKIWEILEKYIK